MNKPIKILAFVSIFLFFSTQAFADTKDINIRANNQATKYVAFIVGNNSYKTYTSLHGPDQDVKAIKNIFNDMGFKIINTKIQNLTKAEMEQATQSFIREIDKNTVAIFYYSGHGTSYENTNYLVPVNADFISEAVDADLNLYSADKLLNLIEQKGARTSIAIFDSCRNNLNISKDKSVSPNGFTIMASSGTQVVYATAPGIVARSATSPNAMSPFTQALIESINDSNNMTFYDVIRQASRETKKATNNAQQPYVGGTGDFEFVLRSKQDLARGQIPVNNIRETASPSPIISTPNQDDSITLYNTGMDYYNEKNYKSAMEWLIKAASQNFPQAQYMIGVMHYKGVGTPLDYTKAMKWFVKAAEQNQSSAQDFIGHLYQNGYGVSKDYIKAMEWYKKAAEQDNLNSQYSIGYMFEKGYGVSQDYKKAMEWYMKAAEKNSSEAQYRIGRLYLEGYGVPKDKNKARSWLEKSKNPAATGWLMALDNDSIK